MRLAALFIYLTILSLLSPPESMAKRRGEEGRLPLLEARYTASGPALDGDPADPVWAEAIADSAFYTLGQGSKPSSLTTVRALYDDSMLYFLFTCRGKPTDALQASEIRRDGYIAQKDDDLEIFFYPDSQDSLYVHLVTNPIGAKSDIQSSELDYYKDFSWTARPGWSGDRWVVEIGIPLNPFASGVKAGEQWRVNFARHLRISPDSTHQLTWSPLKESFYEPERFGWMKFEKEISFRQAALELDLVGDENLALENLRKLKGKDVYRPIRDFLDVALTMRHTRRPFHFLQERVIDFIKTYPDSSSAFELALRTVYPASGLHKIPMEEVDDFIRETGTILRFKGPEEDLLALSRGLYSKDAGDRERWLAVYRNLSRKETELAATAAYLLLTRTAFQPKGPQEEKALAFEALTTFIDRFARGSASLYLTEGVTWLSSQPSRKDVGGKLYLALKNLARAWPEDILPYCRSLSSRNDSPPELALAASKVEYEICSLRQSPFYSAQKADSLILAIAPFDPEFSQTRLNSMLRERIRDLDAEYTAMGRETIPEAIRSAMELRSHYEGNHPIDMVFALAYENVDSLDKAVDFLERYLKGVGEKYRAKGPVARYLSELKFRREGQSDLRHDSIPRESFRVVYRVQPFEGIPDYLEAASDGQAILYPGIPDSLDPRFRTGSTTPAHADSPAVAFRLTTDEIDSLHALFTRFDHLKLKLRYMEPCPRCGNTELTLVTPWNMRTVHFEGEDLSKAPFRLNQAVTALLSKYVDPVFYLRADWKGLSRYYRLWGEYNAPGLPPNGRLDLLLALFSMEPVPSSWKDRTRYVEPLLELARMTGREPEVDAAIGIRYFDSEFTWRRYKRERLPQPEAESLEIARNHLTRAASGSRDERQREWLDFLSDISLDFTGDLEPFLQRADGLRDQAHREQARSILIWLACARGDSELAERLYTALFGSGATKETKYLATIRMMLFHRDGQNPEGAFADLARIERDYSKYLRVRREGPIRDLSDYSRIDLRIDKARLELILGRSGTTASIAGAIPESDVPVDRKEEYAELLSLASHPVIPSVFNPEDIKDYLQILSALGRFGLYEPAARWSIWLLDNRQDRTLNRQILRTLSEILQRRDIWDDLQMEAARKLFEAYRSEPKYLPTDPTETIIDQLLAHVEPDGAADFWREEIRPHPLESSQLMAMDKLAAYFRQHNDDESCVQVYDKIRRELPVEKDKVPSSELILAKYTLDLASLFDKDLGRKEKGASLADSLTRALPAMSREAYPYLFMALAEWKARHLGWEALVEFVSPRGDSLIRAEKSLTENIYHPPLIPGTPIASPLLALRCLVQKAGVERFDTDFLELLGLDREEADATLRSLRSGPSRLNLDCGQAGLLNWTEAPFQEILKQYSQKRERALAFP